MPEGRSWLWTPRRHCDRGEDAVAAIGLLVDGDVMRDSAEKVELRFYPPEDFFGGCEEADVAEAPYWLVRYLYD